MSHEQGMGEFLLCAYQIFFFYTVTIYTFSTLFHKKKGFQIFLFYLIYLCLSHDSFGKLSFHRMQSQKSLNMFKVCLIKENPFSRFDYVKRGDINRDLFVEFLKSAVIIIICKLFEHFLHIFEKLNKSIF